MHSFFFLGSEGRADVRETLAKGARARSFSSENNPENFGGSKVCVRDHGGSKGLVLRGPTPAYPANGAVKSAPGHGDSREATSRKPDGNV